MTLPAAVSMTATVVGVLFALLTARMSIGPGWRELRPFALCALLAALYSACNVVVTLPVDGEVLAAASRLSLCFGGLHGGAWYLYGAAQERRALGRLDKAMIGGGILFALAALVPGALVSPVVAAREIRWLGVTYRDALPTAAGALCYAFYCLGIAILCARYARRWYHGVAGAPAHCLGLAALCAAGASDSLTAARVYDAPYLIDFGDLTIVCCVGFVVTTRFVASARTLEEHAGRLAATQAELVKRERLAALGELSAVVAHEVRNPLAIMFNALSMLRREPPRPQGGDEGSGRADTLLGIVEEEAQRLRRLVDELLAFARPQSLHVAPSDVAGLVSSAVDAARHVDPSASIVSEVASDVPAIECDAELIRGALVNLLSNALHATRHTQPVRVRATLEDGHVCVSVADDGTGVPPELVERLFTPFFTTRPTGTGLGLAVVRRVAEAHGGEARLASTGRGGTTFVLRLPVARG